MSIADARVIFRRFGNRTDTTKQHVAGFTSNRARGNAKNAN